MTGHGDLWSQLAILANLTIVAGYLVVPFTALRLIPMPRRVRVAGVGFFLTCATTHLYMAFAPEHHHGRSAGGWLFWFMLVNHLLQAVCVLVFVMGLSAAVRRAVCASRQPWTGCPDSEVHGDGGPDAQPRQP